ncbi:non-ribosomal peptide synthetase [Mesobacillus foraminis]|uniref:non-ribosomal peptide synthetase n=1 Tax=Mesobacillus foraminis TaxID=279826 RepID=UPI000EF51CB5|nr:non-ribosomal peptide synthetase [Mesobacillus foraminis]
MSYLKGRGRVSNLVRINGRRVDLTQIEKGINQHPAVKQCAIVAKQPDSGSLQLMAFITAEQKLDFRHLCSELNIEEHMLPTGFIQLPALPVTEDGQVDKDLLKQYQISDLKEIDIWEKEIRSIPGIEHAAIVNEEAVKDLEYIHTSDLGFLEKSGKKQSLPVKNEQTDQGELQLEESSAPLAIIRGGEQAAGGDEPTTLVEVIERAAQNHRNHGVFFIDTEGTKSFLAYPELLTEAKSVLSGLVDHGVRPKDKVVFQLEDNRDFVSAFWGCILGGFVPVPVTVPKSFADSSNDANTLKNIVKSLGNPFILTNNPRLSEVETLFQATLERNRIMSISDVKSYAPSEEIYLSSPDDLAIILYTSGSTGMPKGVMQSHQTIIARERGTTALNRFTSEDISVNWMPLEHVGGIVMFHIKEVYLGCTQIQVDTNYILTEPLRWLDLIDSYKATLTWAPNFAYSLVVDRVEQSHGRTWDLSTMRFILNAGEAINAKSCKKFLTKLHKFGLAGSSMFPTWGMSETCSGVVYSNTFTAEPHTGIRVLDTAFLTGKVSQVSEAIEGLTFTELGRTIPGVDIRIVDSNNELVREGVIGSIQIKGKTITLGYYQNQAENEKAFTEDGWFQTGDQGFIYNGSLTITGRIKDLLIINGVNYSNVEIESLVEEVERVALSYAAACAIRENESDTDKIAIFYASELSNQTEIFAQIKQVRKKISDSLGLSVDYILPVTKEDIPKTNIGKIQRSKLVNQFMEGKFLEPLKQVDLFEKNERTIPNWFFEKKWSCRKPEKNASDLTSRTFLFFEEEATRGIAKEIAAQGGTVITVLSGESKKKIDEQTYVIDRSEKTDYLWLMGEIRKGDVPTDLLVSANSGYDGGILSNTEINAFYQKGIYTLLYLIQASSHLHSKNMNLYVLTKNSQNWEKDTSLNFADAVIPGFIKSAALENSWLNCCHIDFDHHSMTIPLIDELTSQTMAPQVIYRNHKRYIPLLSPLTIQDEKQTDAALQSEGLYLITGGLGGIGVEVIKELSHKFGLKFIIVGRTVLPYEDYEASSHAEGVVADRLKACRELAANQAEFIYTHGDITDPEFIKASIEKGEMKWGIPLSGVFHLAGEGNLEDHWKNSDHHWIKTETTAAYENMFKAKVHGTLAIHEAIKDDPEAAFILFSSVNGYFGASTFSAYSAANSFVDHFSAYRSQNGYPNTFCFSWSMWDDIGMSQNNTANQAAASKGFMTISAKQGLNSLLLGLSLKRTALFVGLDGNNPHIRSISEFDRNLELMPTVYYTSTEAEFNSEMIKEKLTLLGAAEDIRLVKLADMPLYETGSVDYTRLNSAAGNSASLLEKDEELSETETIVAKIFKEILKVHMVKKNDSFFELGGHSLKATQVLSRIQSEFQVKLPVQVIFQYPTVAKIAGVIDSNRENETQLIEIPKLPEQEYYELSHAQKRVYFLTTMDSESHNYNIIGTWKLKGNLKSDLLEKSLQILVDRHESLRTTFTMVNETPVQKINKDGVITCYYADLSELDQIAKERAVEELTLSEAERKYSLEEGPLMVATIVKLEEHQHLLLIAQHHIISDGWSLGVLIQELSNIYEAYLQGKTPELQPVDCKITDYISWHNKEADNNSENRQYWMNQLKGELPVIELPLDHPRPAMRTYNGDTKQLKINADLTKELNEICKKQGTSLFMTLLAAYKVFLYKLTGNKDIIVGSPIAGRNHKAAEKLVGMFVNTLPFRTFLKTEETFTSLLERVKQTTLEGYEHQDYPFDKLVEDVNPERDMSRTPIFQVMMGLLNVPLDLKLGDLQIQELIKEQKVSKFDLTLHVFERDHALSIYFEYNTDLFTRGTMNRWMGYFKNILGAITESPAIKINEIVMQDKEELEYFARNFNQTAVPYPSDKTVQELFEEQVILHPQKPAINCNGQEISYADLNQRANAIAKKLRESHTGKSKVAGIFIDRSIEAIAGIIGILKAGFAYLPIDRKYPRERIHYMIESSNAEVILTKSEYDGSLLPVEVLQLHQDEELRNFVEENPPKANGTSDLAYVLFTSGSTGQPKGVMVEHKNIVRLVKNTNFIAFDEDDKVLQTGALTFDASTFEIWGSLLNGLTLFIVDDHIILDAEQLEQAITSNEITTMWLSSPLFNQLSQESPSMFRSLKSLVVGGDALSVKHVNAVRKECPELTLINGYGPTENTTFTTTFTIDKEYGQSIPIGTPINNTTVFILDKDQNICPIGVPGELYAGGDGVARGYMNDASQTAEKFITHPLAQGSTLYRTGDIVKWNKEGSIEYVGRADHQVKIRGYRIECDEIMNTILACEGVKESAVFVRKDSNGHKSLVAYVVGDQVTNAAVKKHLKQLLPDYMIPAAITVMSKFPLLNSGKIDYKALPEPQYLEDANEGFEAPRNEMERKIVEVYQDVLGAAKVSVYDSFFELGGDSLLSIKLVSKLREKGYVVDPKMVFMFQTPWALAEMIENTEESTVAGEREHGDYLIPLNSSTNQEAGLILAPPAGGTIMGYIHLAKELDCPVYGLQAPGLYEDEEPEYLSYEELVAFFMKSIEGTYRPGVDFLGGHSLGGHIAFGLCQELIKQGRPPKGLIILDTTPSLQLIEGAANEDVNEEELKMLLLALGMGNMVGIPQEQLNGLSYESAKKVIIEAAKKDEKVNDFLTGDYLDKYLQLQLHNVMMSRVLELDETKLPVPIIVMKTTDHPEEIEERFTEWEKYSLEKVKYIEVPGNHVTMMRAPHVQRIAEHISGFMPQKVKI